MSLLTKSRVAIIGRPNVGKSTLFNVLLGNRRSLVKDQPGVTRDLIITDAEVWGKTYELIDSGGLTQSSDAFSHLIFEQVSDLLGTVDLLLVVVDGRAGLCPEDRDVLRLAKQSGKPFLTLVNKVDSIPDEESLKADFYELGVDLLATSFENRWGLQEILEWIHSHTVDNTPKENRPLTLAIVGKPNAGKSSLCNYLLQQNRMLVSDIAGTTTDAVDSPLLYRGKQYLLIDTAGLRRSAKRKEGVEKLSAFKSIHAIERADIVLLIVDGLQGVSSQDARIIEEICNNKKGVVLVANKSDLGKSEIENYRKEFRLQVEKELHFFPGIIIEFISAKTGMGVEQLFEKIDLLWEKIHIRIPTWRLNDFFFDVIRKAPAPVYESKDVKFYYLTQTQQIPPSFIAFANYPDGVNPSYRRFLINQIRKKFDLEGVPVQIFVMKSK